MSGDPDTTFRPAVLLNAANLVMRWNIRRRIDLLLAVYDSHCSTNSKKD
jgi:hypothetical protein